nr:retinal guanylyl cyclase 2-like [Pogona vitticeps]
MVTSPFPTSSAVFNVGLMGPWSCDPFFAKAFPQIAAKLAMERIKKDPSLSDIHPMNCTLCDEDCRTGQALAGFISYEKDLSAFIGPLNPGYCDTASLLSRSWNKAIFSWACVNDDLDNASHHPTFVRAFPSSTGVLLAVPKYFQWAHVGIIFSPEELWVDTASKLAIALRNHGLPVALVTSIGKEEENTERMWAKIQAAGNVKELGIKVSVCEKPDLRRRKKPLLSGNLNKNAFYANVAGEELQVSPLFGTIYDTVYLVAKAVAKSHHHHQTSKFSGIALTQHVKNLDFAGFSRRVQTDSRGRPLAKYVILDTDGKGSQLFPTHLLVASSGTVHSLGRPIHFPGGWPLPADSSCWHRALYHQVLKGSKKVLLTLDDLTFVNTKLSKMRLALDNWSDSRSNSECRSLRSATHSLSVRSALVTHETSNVAVYEGDWVWLKKFESGVANNLRQPTVCLLSKMKDVRHENVNPFFGLLSDGGLSGIVMEYCSRGSLEDLLLNTDIKLDWMFKSSLLTDLIKGMRYLHHQNICHGRLKSRNCVVDGRFMLKITDYGYAELLAAQHALYVEPPAEELLWTAPELLRDPMTHPNGTFKGDVYSFAIILQEVVLRSPPYSMSEIPAEEILLKLKKPPPLYRPSVSPDQTPLECIHLMKQCWSERPEKRPTFEEIFEQFKTINKGKKTNIIDSMLRTLEQYSSNLEELIRERTEELEMEKQKTEKLLTRMLPRSVAEKLKTGSTVEPEYFEEVTIYFSDIIGFTAISALSEPIEIVDLLNDLNSTSPAPLQENYVFAFQVETIGDAYMVVSGLPKRNGPRHAAEMANMSLDILSSVGSFRVKHLPGVPVRIRMGLHSGPCAAGVVGLTMPRYCLFGDTVNMASRIESTGLPYRIHISQSTMKTLRSLQEGYKIEFRGKTELKGKGLEETYWLLGKKGFTKPLPTPPEMKPGQAWQDMIVQEIKSALRDSKAKVISKRKK